MLKGISTQLLEVVKNKGIVGRYGGDEFIFIFENITEYNDLWNICFSILKSPKEIMINNEEYISFSYTLGVARFLLDTNDMNDLLDLADKALYRGKMKGRNCYIIYLAKHKDINFKFERDKNFSSKYLHSKIFNELTKKGELATNIKNIIDFLGSYLMIDHICIVDRNNLIFEYYHPLCKNRSYPLEDKLINSSINYQSGYFCENCVINSKKKDSLLYSELIKQEIYAITMVKIEAYRKIYGYLKDEVLILNTGRIWQNLDIDLFLSLCNNLALILASNEK